MASANVVELKTDNWEQEVVNSDKPVLVDFWAPWCGPCRALNPIIERLADQFAGQVKVGKLNTEESPEIATGYGVTAIPRLMIFKGSEKPLHTMVGLQSESKIVDMIKNSLG